MALLMTLVRLPGDIYVNAYRVDAIEPESEDPHACIVTLSCGEAIPVAAPAAEVYKTITQFIQKDKTNAPRSR